MNTTVSNETICEGTRDALLTMPGHQTTIASIAEVYQVTERQAIKAIDTSPYLARTAEGICKLTFCVDNKYALAMQRAMTNVERLRTWLRERSDKTNVDWSDVGDIAAIAQHLDEESLPLEIFA